MREAFARAFAKALVTCALRPRFIEPPLTLARGSGMDMLTVRQAGALGDEVVALDS